jgi:hypothetical protein
MSILTLPISQNRQVAPLSLLQAQMVRWLTPHQMLGYSLSLHSPASKLYNDKDSLGSESYIGSFSSDLSRVHLASRLKDVCLSLGCLQGMVMICLPGTPA